MNQDTETQPAPAGLDGGLAHASATSATEPPPVQLSKRDLRRFIKDQEKARLSGRVVTVASVWNRKRRRRDPAGYEMHLVDLEVAGKADAARTKAIAPESAQKGGEYD